MAVPASAKQAKYYLKIREAVTKPRKSTLVTQPPENKKAAVD